MSSHLTEKERENAELEGEEKEVKEEKTGEEVLSEEQELEELRAQVLLPLLELEEARDTSQKHQESFLELQGEDACGLEWGSLPPSAMFLRTHASVISR